MTSDARRTFLKRGLFGGALLAGASLGLSLWPTRKVTPARALQVLDERELAIMVAVAETIAPDADGRELAHRVDEYVAALAPGARRDLKRLLLLVESGLAGALLDARPRPFTWLPPAARTEALHAMRDSRLTLRRGGYQVLRRLVMSMRWSDAATWPAIGYAGPPQIGSPG